MGKKLKDYALAIAALMCSSSVHSDVIINEIMPCNITTYINEEKDFTGWVELYNNGTSDVDIKGWTFTNYNKKSKKGETTETIKWSWVVSSEMKIAKGQYLVISFDSFQPEEGLAVKGKHVPFKVDPDGGSLALSNSKGYEDRLKYPQMRPHISYGIGKEANGYMVPTPGSANGTSYASIASNQCEKPAFGTTQPGVYPKSVKEEGKKIKLSCATTGATIRYTLDGSEPTEKSLKFIPDSSYVKLDSTRVIRARAFKSGKLPSDILSGSFLIYSGNRSECDGDDPAVVSIITNKDYFYDSKIGMCVGPDKSESGVAGAKNCVASAANYNRDWQRGVNFEYFEEGKQAICQEALVGIMGGCSRKHAVKSLKVSTNKRTGNETFNYKIYKNEATKKENIYSSFQLRNGGNGYDELVCRDGFIQNIAKGISNLDYQAYIPVSYYINGKYQGMMGLRERTNESYIKANYGLDEDKIDIVEFSEKKIEAACGDLNAYNEMYAFVTDSVNYKKENFVALLDNYMDVEEYVNYMIFEQFIVNTDWPGNNQKAWRKHVGGKFRWILYDTDFGLGRFGYDGENFTYKELNTVKWCTGEGEHNWANDMEHEWKTKFFKCLMKNQGFRDMFLTKALVLLAGPLSGKTIENVKDEFLPTVVKEHCVSNKVEGRDTYTDAKDKLNSLVKFAKERNSIYKKDLASYCKLDTAKKTVLTITAKGDYKSNVEGYYVNNIMSKGNSFKLKGISGMNVSIRPILPDGYIIKKWNVKSDTTLTYTKQNIGFSLKGDTIAVELTIAQDTYDKPTIVINEICPLASAIINPDTKESADWLELYNTGNEYVNVAGYYLSDSDTTIKIESGYEMTNIPPKGHLLLWADDRGKSGAQHLPFKLSSNGETITLTKRVRDSVILVDQVKYGTMDKADYSYGREKDGATKFTTFAACANSDFSEATPGESNGKYNCETIIDELTYSVSLACQFEGAKYNVNDKVVGPNKTTTYILKGKSLTVSPVLPVKAEFVKWVLSEPIESYDSIISRSSSWKYHYADSQPKGNWTALKYTDSNWKTGNGYMGFDESNKNRGFSYNTPIAYNKKGGELGDSAKYITAYFRNTFNIEDTSIIKSLTANIVYDDGAAVYLNGKEIGRYNLPEDSVLTYNTTTITYNDDQKAEIKIDPKKLIVGNNVIAVEVHQIDRASSDLTFALNLKAKCLSKTSKERSFSLTPKGKFSATLYVNDYTDVDEEINAPMESALSFYPNPTSSMIYVQNADKGSVITISDLTGRLLIMQLVEEDVETIDLSKLMVGSYIVNATLNGQRNAAKIIKR